MELTAFAPEDFTRLYAYMEPLWHKTYSGIIPPEQIDFLLRRYFSDEGIRRCLSEGYSYFKLIDGTLQGVVVICEKDGTTYLDKLYLSESSRGKGYPAFAFSELLKLGRDITLNVNQGNARAVRCYEKNGFFVEETQEIDLGGGMVNRDFKMRLRCARTEGAC